MIHSAYRNVKKQADLEKFQEILNTIAIIERAIDEYGNDYEEFKQNRMFQMILKASIEDIGEASKDLSPSCKELYTHLIDWDELRTARNEFAHSYRRTLNYGVLWDKAFYYIETLRRRVEEAVADILEHGIKPVTERKLLESLYSIYSKTSDPVKYSKFQEIFTDGVCTFSDEALCLWKTPLQYKQYSGMPFAFIACKMKKLKLDFPFWFDIQYRNQTLIHYLVQRQTLPNDFPFWDRNVDGSTVAHLALEHGHLPSNFSHWEIRNVNGRTVAHDFVESQIMSPQFKQWGLTISDGSGWSVAHEAAQYGTLPDDFDLWGLVDASGELVGFVAVRNGRIPDDPNAWCLCNSDGWTIAHEMARCHRIPSDFDQFDLQDKHGRTVADIMRKVGDDPDGQDFSEENTMEDTEYGPSL